MKRNINDKMVAFVIVTILLGLVFFPLVTSQLSREPQPFPGPRDISRNDPQINVVGLIVDHDDGGVVGFPRVHAIVVGDEPGSRPELCQELGPEPQVNGSEEVERDDARLVKVSFENVLLEELDEMGDPGLGGVLLAFLDALGVDIDPDAAGPEELGGRDDDPAVATAKVIEQVILGDLRHPEHLGHNLGF